MGRGGVKGLPAVPLRMLQVVCAKARVATAGDRSVDLILARQHISHITHPLISSSVTKTQSEPQMVKAFRCATLGKN